ncbi:MAG: hypothetical protein PHW02_01650 [bacterium]|nr:hypothetical protein [bacterium]
MNNQKKSFGNLIDSLAWAAFFIMTGVLWLLPGSFVPNGSWLIATGAILIAANLIKNFGGVKSTSGYFFGTLFTLFGIMKMVDAPFQFMPIFFIAVGSFTIISGLLEIRFSKGGNINTNDKERI